MSTLTWTDHWPTGLPPTIARVRERLGEVAFAAYIVRLREFPRRPNGGARLTQEEVVALLRGAPFYLKTSTKDVSQWETAKRLPTASNRAALLEVLGGESGEADRLLLYAVHRELPTLAQAEDAVVAEPTLAELIEEALLTGTRTADDRLETNRLLAEAVASRWQQASEERRQVLLAVLAKLERGSEGLADELLRYGRFLSLERSPRGTPRAGGRR